MQDFERLAANNQENSNLKLGKKTQEMLPLTRVLRRKSMFQDVALLVENVPLLDLAKKGRFTEILDILNNKQIDVSQWLDISSTSTRSSASCFEIFKGGSILHIVLKHKPPGAVVEMLIQRTKLASCNDNRFQPETVVDMYGQTPLHVALCKGLDFDVVQRLMNVGRLQSPAFIRDSWLRYPLHWACVYPQKLRNRSYQKLNCRNSMKGVQIEDWMQIIKLLVTAYPGAAQAQDIDGSTPCDLAKENGAAAEILMLLENPRMRQKEIPLDTITETDEDLSHSLVDVNFSFKHVCVTTDRPSLKDEGAKQSSDEISSLGSGGISKYQQKPHLWEQNGSGCKPEIERVQLLI